MYSLLEDVLLLRHVSVQSNYLQAIYIWSYVNYYTYNRSIVFGSNQVSLIHDI
jgi:hypothetical protein